MRPDESARRWRWRVKEALAFAIGRTLGSRVVRGWRRGYRPPVLGDQHDVDRRADRAGADVGDRPRRDRGPDARPVERVAAQQLGQHGAVGRR